MIYTRLLHDFICQVPVVYGVVNGNISVCYGAVPYVMVALSVADERTAFVREFFYYVSCIICHYDTAA